MKNGDPSDEPGPAYSGASSSFHFRIDKICRFFLNTHGSGILFCTSSITPLVMEVNRILIQRLWEKNFVLKEFRFTEPDNIFYQLETAIKDCDGLLLTNLDEMILLHADRIIHNINFIRDDLVNLQRPLLFWLSDANISLFANKASDLYSRRDRSIIDFPELDGKTLLTKHDPFYEQGFKTTDAYQIRSIKVEILEKQLTEAQAHSFSKERIANEIALDLIEQYTKADLNLEADALFEKYKEAIDLEKSVKAMDIIANLYRKLGRFDEAIELFNRSLFLKEGNPAGMAYNYNQLGMLYTNKGEWDRALEFYFKSEKIIIAVGDRVGLGRTYNNIGMIYSNKGEWDRALEFYLKSETNYNEVGDRRGLSATYNNIGGIYSNKGEWERALEFYFKSEKIVIEVGDRGGLSATYNNIGLIYSKKGEWERALEFYLKDEKISIEVGDRGGLGATYNNIGGIYSNKGECERALEFYLKSEKIRIEVGDKGGLGYTNLNIAAVYYQQNNRLAVERIDEAVRIFQEVGAAVELKKALEGQEMIYKWFGKGKPRTTRKKKK